MLAGSDLPLGLGEQAICWPLCVTRQAEVTKTDAVRWMALSELATSSTAAARAGAVRVPPLTSVRTAGLASSTSAEVPACRAPLSINACWALTAACSWRFWALRLEVTFRS